MLKCRSRGKRKTLGQGWAAIPIPRHPWPPNPRSLTFEVTNCEEPRARSPARGSFFVAASVVVLNQLLQRDEGAADCAAVTYTVCLIVVWFYGGLT
jgi:hypothetical protein